jgi:hypothetical protein
LAQYLNTKDGLHQKLQKGRLKEFQKCKREADKDLPGSFSPLNTAQPNMLPMTFYGMRMLYHLKDVPGFCVHPTPNNRRTGPLLMEVMPGAALRAFGLPDKTYKSSINALRERQTIVEKLADRSRLQLPNLEEYYDHCMFSDDAIDSIVATAVAAKWARGDNFTHPNTNPSSVVRLEGGICVP